MILINQIFNTFYKNENIKKENIILSDYDKFFYISGIIIILIILNKINITSHFMYSLLIISGIIYIIYYYEQNNKKDEKVTLLNTYLDDKSYLYNHNVFIDFLYGIKHFDNEVIFQNLINNTNLFLKYYDDIQVNKDYIKISILKDISKNTYEIYKSYIFNLSDKFDEEYQNNLNLLFRLLNKYIDSIIDFSNNNMVINNTSILDNKNDISLC